jgi:hypothetical protein
MLSAGQAVGDDSPSPGMHALMQIESAEQSSNTDVELIVSVGQLTGNLQDKTYRVERENQGSIFFIHEAEFDEEEAFDAEVICTDPIESNAFCPEDTEYCVDCDEDGVPECWHDYGTACTTKYYFEIEDLCVPAGTATYKLYRLNLYEGDEYDLMDEKSIELPYWDDTCEDQTGVLIGDTDCSVVGVGTAGLNGIMSTALFLVGLLFFVTSSRKSRN